MRDAIASELASHGQGLTARELARSLRGRGFDVDKSSVNATLYRSRNRFAHDGATPPRWFLGHAEATAIEPPPRLTELVVRNWKSFRLASAQLGPITLIYGANSSGKSSLLQSLLLLHQARSSPGLIFEGAEFDSGGFSNCVHLHDESQALYLSFDAEGEEPLTLGRGIASNELTDDGEITMLTLGAAADATFMRMEVGGKTVWGSAGLQEVLATLPGTGVAPASADSDPLATQWVLDDDNGRPGRIRSRVEAGVTTGAPARLSKAWLQFRDHQFARAEHLMARVRHVPPMRAVPPDWVLESADTQGDSDELVHRLARDHDLLEELNHQLDKLEVPYEVTIVAQVVAQGTEVGLRGKRRGGDQETVRLRDVGYGVGQLIPVVVEAIAAKETILLIEQPEVHLHPRLQARLADLFIDSMLDYRNQLIIETHSEHLLLRLQRRMAERRIDHDSVIVQYVQRVGSTAEVFPLELEADGTMAAAWPTDFFDDRLDDLIHLLGTDEDEQ